MQDHASRGSSEIGKYLSAAAPAAGAGAAKKRAGIDFGGSGNAGLTGAQAVAMMGKEEAQYAALSRSKPKKKQGFNFDNW